MAPEASFDTEARGPPGGDIDMPLGVAMAVQAQLRVPHCDRFAVLSEDDIDSVERAAPTMCQEPRPTRRLLLVGSRSGREGGKARHPERDPPGHADADTDSVVSDGWQECPVRAMQRRLKLRPSVAAQRSGFARSDRWDISEVFSCRASVMRTVPQFLWGSFRVALKVALEEIRVRHSTWNTQRQERRWKLFLLLRRPLLDSNPDMHLLFMVGELFSWGQIPHDIVQMVKLGRRMVGCAALR